MRFQRLEDLRIDADKTQEEILCFAEKVLNWRSTDVAQANFCATAPNRRLRRCFFLPTRGDSPAPIKKGAFQLLFCKFS